MKTVSIFGLLILTLLVDARAEITSGQTNANEPYYCVPCKKWIFPKLGPKEGLVATSNVAESAAPGKAHLGGDAGVKGIGSGTDLGSEKP